MNFRSCKQNIWTKGPLKIDLSNEKTREVIRRIRGREQSKQEAKQSQTRVMDFEHPIFASHNTNSYKWAQDGATGSQWTIYNENRKKADKIENLYSLSGNSKVNLKRFQKKLKSTLYSEHSPEHNLNSILQSLQSMKDSQKKRIREQSRRLHKKRARAVPEKENANGAKDKSKPESSSRWIERLDGFQHLNGCNININNNFINITTLQNKELRRNMKLYKELEAEGKLSRFLDTGATPEAQRKGSEPSNKLWGQKGQRAKARVEKMLGAEGHPKKSAPCEKIRQFRVKSSLEKTEKKVKKSGRPESHLGKKLMSILKTSPENEKRAWFGAKGLKSSAQLETYNSCDKDQKAKKLKMVRKKGEKARKEKGRRAKPKKGAKNAVKKISIANLKKSEPRDKNKHFLKKNEYNSLKKEAKKGDNQRKNFETLDLRTFTNKENRRVPISCKNKANPEAPFRKPSNKTFLDLFLQKKCENIEELLKQKISKSRKEKIEIMFRRDSTRQAGDVEGLARLLERPKPLLSNFHTSKEKSSIQETHESFLGLKPRTRMAKMMPNYINSIDNNINSIQNLHYRRKMGMSRSRMNQNSNSPSGLANAQICSKGDLKKIRLATKMTKLRELGSSKPRDPRTSKSKRFSNYSGLKRKSKGSKRKSSQMKQNKGPGKGGKRPERGGDNKERLRLRSITEIENYKNSRSIKHAKNHSSKNQNLNLIFKKKISLPDKHKKKETYRLFKSKWGISNNVDNLVKEASHVRFDFRGVKARLLTDQQNRRKL